MGATARLMSKASRAADRPRDRAVLNLCDSQDLLRAGQKLLCLGLAQTHVRDIGTGTAPGGFHHVDAVRQFLDFSLNQPQNLSH